MRIIFASATPEIYPTREAALQIIETYARVCHKSEDKIEAELTSDFIRRIFQVKHHESVIEHVNVSVRFICDRGISHELVRHRLCAFSQESTRYCNYSKSKFGNEITVIQPPIEDKHALSVWLAAMQVAEKAYFNMLSLGCSAQIARSVLPNSLKTEIAVTTNLREWHHILTLRTSTAAHPQMRELMIPLLKWFTEYLPEIFDNIKL